MPDHAPFLPRLEIDSAATEADYQDRRAADIPGELMPAGTPTSRPGVESATCDSMGQSMAIRDFWHLWLREVLKIQRPANRATLDAWVVLPCDRSFPGWAPDHFRTSVGRRDSPPRGPSTGVAVTPANEPGQAGLVSFHAPRVLAEMQGLPI